MCRAAEMLGYLLIVVTNQAGIARGYYTESEFQELTNWMVREFVQHGASIARVYYCPYHPLYGIGRYNYDSADRKPKPGMLLRAQADLNLDLASSILIGDKLSDIEAGTAAGVGTNILLCSSVTGAAAKQTLCHMANSLDDIRGRFFSTIHCSSTKTARVFPLCPEDRNLESRTHYFLLERQRDWSAVIANGRKCDLLDLGYRPTRSRAAG